MKKIITLLISLSAFTFSTLTHAADLSKTEKVEKLFVLMDTDKIIDTMYTQMENMSAGMAQQMGVKEDEQELFDAYMADVMAIMKEDLSWAKMKQPMADVYIKHYTEEELDGMIAFFGSDVGRSMTEKMPQVMQDSMVVTQSMMQTVMPKVQQAAQQMQQKLNEQRQGS